MAVSTASAIFYAVLAFSWVEYLWSAYLGSRQRKIYRTRKEVPAELKGITDAETFEKSRLYALDKSSFGAVESAFSQCLSTLIMWCLGFKVVWDLAGQATEDETYRSMLFVFYFNVFNLVIGLPFSIYKTFVLEEKHGFNKQTVPFYVKDQIKKFVVMQIIILPLVAAIIKIIHWGGEYFFVYLWFFVLVFTIFMMVVYPEFIAPLFDKYTPLPDGDLRTKIEELASSIHFPLYKLFVVEGSKRSSHSNAYFYGFFKFKRIVLFDTLLEESERQKLKTDEEKEADAKKVEEMSDEEKKKLEEEKKKGCSTPEILAVLAHELGHWSLSHVLKNILISEVHIFLMFALFGYLYQLQVLYTAFGFPDERPVLIGLMIILQFVTAPYNAVLDFMMICLTRRFEFQADAFAVEMDKAEELKTALAKLNNDNLSFPIFDWLYSAWNHSHPPLLERLAAIDEGAEKKKEK